MPASSTANLSVPLHDPLHGGEGDEPHGAPPVEAAGRDAELGAQAELAPVVEAGRRVDGDASGVDLAPPAKGVGLVPRADGLRVTRAVPRDVGERAVEAVDHPHGQDGVEELAAPV